jgi:hypothetical protein
MVRRLEHVVLAVLLDLHDGGLEVIHALGPLVRSSLLRHLGEVLDDLTELGRLREALPQSVVRRQLLCEGVDLVLGESEPHLGPQAGRPVLVQGTGVVLVVGVGRGELAVEVGAGELVTRSSPFDAVGLEQELGHLVLVHRLHQVVVRVDVQRGHLPVTHNDGDGDELLVGSGSVLVHLRRPHHHLADRVPTSGVEALELHLGLVGLQEGELLVGLPQHSNRPLVRVVVQADVVGDLFQTEGRLEEERLGHVRPHGGNTSSHVSWRASSAAVTSSEKS